MATRELVAIKERDVMKVTVNANILRELASAGECASTDTARPILTGIKLAASDGKIKAICTDSYALVIKEAPADIAEDGEILISAKQLITYAKANKAGSVTITAAPDAPVMFSGQLVQGFDIIGGTYPNIDTLIPSGDGEEVVAINFNPALLGRFSKVAPWNDKRTCMKLHFYGDKRPAKITPIGSHDVETLALLMPVRGE